MVLRRVLLENEAWFITAGILGMSIKVHDKERGLTRRATRYERLYLLEVFERMQHSGIRVGPGSPEIGEVSSSSPKPFFFAGARHKRRYFSQLLRRTGPILSWLMDEGNQWQEVRDAEFRMASHD